MAPKKGGGESKKRKAKASEAEEEDQLEKQEDQHEEEEEEGGAKGGASETEEGTGAAPKKAKKKKELPIITERTPLPRQAIPSDVNTFSICSWNVNGFAALHKSSLAVLESLVTEVKPDVLCLQETKLQQDKVPTYAGLLRKLGYTDFWNCSTVKKGYAGTAVFVRDPDGALESASVPDAKAVAQSEKQGKQKKLSSFFQPKGEGDKKASSEEGKGGHSAFQGVTYGFHKDHDGEGRVITVEHEKLYVVNVYVPNSGMKLERLDYRLNEWNPAFRDYIAGLAKTKPVVVCGDINVAHRDTDMYNVGHPHVKKVPGCTPQERQAQTDFLAGGWIDVFATMHPNATGHYTYWNVRTGARKENKGLRLDTFLMPVGDGKGERGVKPLDCYALHEETLGVSDHCPVNLVLSF